jgi:Ca2+-binding EF-hand superfamily protein
LQLQQDVLWEKWVDMAFQKLDSNGDGFIDLEELIAKLPIDDATSAATRTERHLEVGALRLSNSK